MGKVRQATREPLVAWSLTGSALVVLAAALVLLGLNASQPDASRLDAGQIGLYGPGCPSEPWPTPAPAA